MRLWSLSPELLDTKGLVALWREALLAKAVLEGQTKGYKNHPQLDRFKRCKNPIGAINYYLSQVYAESVARGYSFNSSKFIQTQVQQIPVTNKQLEYEFMHLSNKLKVRSPKTQLKDLKLHPLFTVIPGKIENWEKL